MPMYGHCKCGKKLNKWTGVWCLDFRNSLEAEYICTECTASLQIRVLVRKQEKPSDSTE